MPELGSRQPVGHSARMTAAVLEAIHEPLTIKAVPRPRPDRGQALVRVRAAGVCHTDLHLAGAVPSAPPVPLILGHEIAGDIAELGEGAETDLAVDDRALVYYYRGCGHCAWCAQWLENMCRAPQAKYGFDTDGGFAEYIAVDARCLVALPDGVAYADAAVLGCSGTTGLHVADTVAKVSAGETVVVIGAGGVGLASMQVAVGAGASVLVVDPHEGSRKAAMGLGAVSAVDPADGDPVRMIWQATDGAGADVVVDTVGNDRTPGMAARMVRPQGRVVLVGYTERSAKLDVSDVVVNETIIMGSVGATLGEARRVMAMARDGTLRALIAAEYPLARLNEALAELAAGQVAGRLVIVP